MLQRYGSQKCVKNISASTVVNDYNGLQSYNSVVVVVLLVLVGGEEFNFPGDD